MPHQTAKTENQGQRNQAPFQRQQDARLPQAGGLLADSNMLSAIIAAVQAGVSPAELPPEQLSLLAGLAGNDAAASLAQAGQRNAAPAGSISLPAGALQAPPAPAGTARLCLAVPPQGFAALPILEAPPASPAALPEGGGHFAGG
jgi:hypothetical protein